MSLKVVYLRVDKRKEHTDADLIKERTVFLGRDHDHDSLYPVRDNLHPDIFFYGQEAEKEIRTRIWENVKLEHRRKGLCPR